MIYLALSCLQGRPQAEAATELLSLGVDGLQLTPGNLASEGFWETLRASGTPYRTHEGYTPLGRRTRVWSESGELLCASDSIHPPKGDGEAFWDLIEDGLPETTVETMYPGYAVSTGADIERLMANGILLAVDISHLNIMRTADLISKSQLDKLLNYDQISEVHVSHNEGIHDTHSPLRKDSYMLDWAREKYASGTTTILESYFHKVPTAERLLQIEMVTN